MICYLCGETIPDDQPFYSDYDKTVCKPCFGEVPRCFVCRFPGKTMEDVAGLGWECEFCRGKLVAEGDDVAAVFEPLRQFLLAFGFRGDAPLVAAWTDRVALRQMQTAADVPREEFIDDFLRYSYPVFYRDGQMHLLRRMTKPTLIAYGIVQLAAAELALAYGLPDLRGETPFHDVTRGWCHWIGFDAAGRLGYDLEQRQLRKWPELGLQGDFERWQASARFNAPAKLVAQFRATAPVLARKHLSAARTAGERPSG
jgi:hypothetical protein